MSKSEIFETLKANALNDYISYISAIEKFSYSDINDLSKRLTFLDSYNKAVSSNVAFRYFINTNSKIIKKKDDET